ncbi:RDD family protein [Shewanella sp. UCD-KL12]|uniref:RDD family protein n=1 Tax=Shewanella sp. UCD-KL12 TaxID=1917163 RepID=UPI000970600B
MKSDALDALKLNPNTEPDPKSIVTPFAFEIAPQVLYTPLATPLKRGLAMLVDGLLISVLAEQAGWVFILLVGLTLLIQRKSRELGKLFKWGLYLSMLIMMLWVTVGNLLPTIDDESIGEEPGFSENQQTVEVVGQFIAFMPYIIRFSVCKTYACADEELAQLLPILSRSKLPVAEQASILTNAIDDSELSADDRERLKRQILAQLAQLNAQEPAGAVGLEQEIDNQDSVDRDDSLPSDVSSLDDTKIEPGLISSDVEQIEEVGNSLSQLNQLQDLDTGEVEQEESGYSLISWAKGILNDLGLGFGWAAFYFTVFTAWFDGQTLGKKLFSIRVIQLDGTKLSLWDAFGRYGGYGAGFATGLLGFLQIYWDANRQAIQDKISATVVIDTKQINRHNS